jgi:acetylornithine deacetylase
MKEIELLKKLVEIESPSGREDEILQFLKDELLDLGFSPKIFGKDVKNLLVLGESNLWIVTHVDVVPSANPFSFGGTFAYGDGVSDAKGSIVSLLLALNEIEDLKFNIAFLSDEEEGGRGSLEFSKSFKGLAIVMEPTELKIAREHYGSIEILLKVRGTSSHASYPEYGDNPIEKSLRVLRDLQKLPVKSVVKMIRSGDERHRIPDLCEMSFEFLIPPEKKTQDILKEIEEILKEYGEFDVVEASQGFKEEPFEILETALKKCGIKVEYSLMKSWTDAVNLKKEGWKTVVWGPGELQFAHTERERIKVEEILKAKKVLIKLNELL